MTIEKMENSAWLGFPKNDPSVTDTVYVPITGGKKNGVYERTRQGKLVTMFLAKMTWIKYLNFSTKES